MAGAGATLRGPRVDDGFRRAGRGVLFDVVAPVGVVGVVGNRLVGENCELMVLTGELAGEILIVRAIHGDAMDEGRPHAGAAAHHAAAAHVDGVNPHMRPVIAHACAGQATRGGTERECPDDVSVAVIDEGAGLAARVTLELSGNQEATEEGLPIPPCWPLLWSAGRWRASRW